MKEGVRREFGECVGGEGEGGGGGGDCGRHLWPSLRGCRSCSSVKGVGLRGRISKLLVQPTKAVKLPRHYCLIAFVSTNDRYIT